MENIAENHPETLRQGFKQMNRFMLLFWRLGLGRWMNIWPQGFGQFVVITHTGRKSGQRYRTPVNFGLVDGEIYVVAGFGQISDWYRNLKANPQVEVWLEDSWWEACAEEVTGGKNDLAILREVMIGSGFAARLFGGIDPAVVSDEELLNLTRDYRLIHLRRMAPRTGPGGPGDLAWVWPLATFLLLPLAFRGRKRQRRCC